MKGQELSTKISCYLRSFRNDEKEFQVESLFIKFLWSAES